MTRAKITPEYKSKSDWARAQFTAGLTVAEVTAKSNTADSMGTMGYAFVYGIAKRFGVADTAANRRRERAVTIDPDSGFVTIRCDEGTVITVDRASAKVTRKAARKITA